MFALITLFQAFLSNITIYLNVHICHIDEKLIGISTLSLSGPGSNGNERVTLHSPELQNSSLMAQPTFLFLVIQSDIYAPTTTPYFLYIYIYIYM